MDIDNERWYVEDKNPICGPNMLGLTIRETKTNRLVAMLPEISLDVKEKIAELRDEARLLAFAPELAFMLERMVYAAETRGEHKYSDGKLYRETKRDAYDLLDRVNGRK